MAVVSLDARGSREDSAAVLRLALRPTSDPRVAGTHQFSKACRREIDRLTDTLELSREPLDG
jgi:hypothetical protein